MKIYGIIFLILLFFPCIAQSGVYKHVDEDGNVTYSNIRLKNAQTVDLPSLTVVPSVKSEAIDSIINRRKAASRDKEQRNTIENLIADEENLLAEARYEYKGGTPDRLGGERNYQRYLDRVERLKNEISVREKNLDALKLDLHSLPKPGGY